MPRVTRVEPSVCRPVSRLWYRAGAGNGTSADEASEPDCPEEISDRAAARLAPTLRITANIGIPPRLKIRPKAAIASRETVTI
jgi:hypothetical protein